jgi:hypothetical protein
MERHDMIRAGRASDAPRVIELLRDSHVAAGFDDPRGISGFVFPFDPVYAERLFFAHLGNERAYCLVHEVAGVPQGVLMAQAFEHRFGPVWLANETVWWIDPAHRGSAAPRMLDDYEAWSRRRRCVFSGMAGMGGDPEVANLYVRRGYRVAETHFLKAL